MIKADGTAKVKERLPLSAPRPIANLVFALGCFLLCTSGFAQIDESDVQRMEAQEFGLDSGNTPAHSDDLPVQETSPLDDHQDAAEAERIKAIEAEEFPVKITKKSTSGRVLMFEDRTENRPRPGRILLIKDGKDELIAVRVLKNYPGKFAAKIVLPVKDHSLNSEYRALKKLGDKIIALIKERERMENDLDASKSDEELALEVSPDDNELDRGIPPPKPKQKGKRAAPLQPSNGGASSGTLPPPLFTPDGEELTADSIEIKEEDEPFADLSVQEDLPLEPRRHALTLQYASLRSIDKDENPATYDGFGLRYAFNVWNMPMWKRKHLQDMFSLELGLFYYAINGFNNPEDSVTVYPIIGTVRYSLLVGENLNFFGYLGFVKNNVSQGDDQGTLSSKTDALATTKAAVGIGSMIRIGPSWAARVDFGTDLFAIGAVLKF